MNWLPAVKVLLPYVGQIVTAAIPVFSKKPLTANGAGSPEEQIIELQEAVVKNAESIRILANQVQELITVIDGSANQVKNEILMIKWLSISALISSIATIIFLLNQSS